MLADIDRQPSTVIQMTIRNVRDGAKVLHGKRKYQGEIFGVVKGGNIPNIHHYRVPAVADTL